MQVMGTVREHCAPLTTLHTSTAALPRAVSTPGLPGTLPLFKAIRCMLQMRTSKRSWKPEVLATCSAFFWINVRIVMEIKIIFGFISCTCNHAPQNLLSVSYLVVDWANLSLVSKRILTSRTLKEKNLKKGLSPSHSLSPPSLPVDVALTGAGASEGTLTARLLNQIV